MLPPILAALLQLIVGDIRPRSGWDRSAMLGADPRRQDAEQAFSQYSLPQRDSVPYPAEVMLPYVIGFNPIPLEVASYYRGSLWASGGNEWEE